MPSSHSKRNTSRADFTSFERSLLRSSWGSQTKILSRDSFLPFGSCGICLHPAVDPVACNGVLANTSSAESERPAKKRRIYNETKCHIFCRECAFTSLLTQKKEIERFEREQAIIEGEKREVEALESEQARARALEDFERVQQGGIARHTDRRRYDWSSGKAEKEQGSTATKLLENGGTKRKRDDAQDATENATEEDKKRARQELDAENEANKSDLKSFWIPSQAPEQNRLEVQPDKPKKLEPLCPASGNSSMHSINRKTLVEVHFKEETTANSADGKTRICPACSKPLTNSTRGVLAKPCGHVVCVSCVDKFVLDAVDGGDNVIDQAALKKLSCYICSMDVTPSSRKKDKEKKGSGRDKIRPGLVEISADGTGFASGGNNLVKKKGTAFQC